VDDRVRARAAVNDMGLLTIGRVAISTDPLKYIMIVLVIEADVII